MTARRAYALPFGAEMIDASRTRFRLWAPDQKNVGLLIDNLSPIAMRALDDGWFECEAYCGADTQYRFAIDNTLVPDPASRCQAHDVDGPSVVCNPREYLWRHDEWRGRPWREMVIYEIHCGCAGGFEGVEKQLETLAAIGITAIELMPIADFAGSRNWGYDGALPFAPDTAYGTPLQLKHLIDTAHGLGLCVYLDVVYNHFGPQGNYLGLYASKFFDRHKQSPWGAAIDFLQPQVRDFFTHNALYWLLEYRFDGLRFDAVHQIGDDAWLDEMAAIVRATIEPERHVHLLLENEHNQARHLRGDFDAQWNDDGHNVLHVLLTGESTGYYANYSDEPAEKLARCLAEGFVYQGEPSPTHGDVPRGTSSADLPPHAFILFLQNHDQIGNRARGERLTALCEKRTGDDNALRAAITLQLLSPQIPLLFMGEEWGSRTPFLFFTDFHDELAAAVREGRRKEFIAQPEYQDESARATIPDPNAILTFTASIPNQDEKRLTRHLRFIALYKQLLTLRQEYIVALQQDCRSNGARVIGPAAVLARWQLHATLELIIAINLGSDDISFEKILIDLSAAQLLFRSDESDGDLDVLPAKTTFALLRSVAGRV